MIIIDVGSCMADHMRDRAIKQGFFFLISENSKLIGQIMFRIME